MRAPLGQPRAPTPFAGNLCGAWMLALGMAFCAFGSELLAGSLAEVLRHEGLEYDPASGRFELNQPGGDRVRLVGSGVPALWTRHALERLGFEVDRGGETDVVALVEVDPDEPRWRLSCREHGSSHATLEDLTRELESRLEHGATSPIGKDSS